MSPLASPARAGPIGISVPISPKIGPSFVSVLEMATTVVGLVAGAVGFLTQQVKQRWYLQDMTNLEFISELLNDKRNNTKATEK